MAAQKPRPPAGLRTSGRALWKAVVGDFELETHELNLLLQAARTADSLDSLQAVLDAEGYMSESSQGPRVHPALVELRQQRITLARLLAALNVPSGDEDAQPARAPRGVYGIRGTAS